MSAVTPWELLPRLTTADVAGLDLDDWGVPDEATGYRILAGNPAIRGKVLWIAGDRRMASGLWECSPGTVGGAFPVKELDVRLSEAQLSRLNIFENDPSKGIRPTVSVLDSDSNVKDVLVTVQETQTGSLLFGVGVNSDAGLTGSVVLNERTQTVAARDREVHLTPIEFRLLRYLMHRPDRPISKEELFSQVWGYELVGGTNLVEVAIRRLRSKIEEDASNPRLIVTVHTVGYKFVSHPNDD